MPLYLTIYTVYLVNVLTAVGKRVIEKHDKLYWFIKQKCKCLGLRFQWFVENKLQRTGTSV